jgi:hypothetical protein
MNRNKLRNLIKEEVNKLNEAKYLQLFGYETDILLAIQWLKNNKILKSAGKISKTKEKINTARVKIKGDKNSAKMLIKDKFGTFIKIK